MAFGNKKFELSPRLRLGVGRGYSQNQILKFSAILCLVIALILTANAVRLVVGSKNQASDNGQSPQVLGASDTQSPGKPNQTQFVSYTVQKGDTLFDISQKFNISWNTVATLNNLKSPFYLKPGQVLQIPKQ
jgi:LysM repeat protein